MVNSHSGHVLSLVFNRVEGDSRVIKTARAAMDAGYDATILGVGSAEKVEELQIEGVRVIRVPNYSKRLAQMGLWPDADGIRRLDLLLEGGGRAMLDAIDVDEIDILHSHDMFGLKLGAMFSEEAATNGRHLPWLHDLHEYVAGLEINASTDYRAAALRYERRFLHRPDALLTVSEPLALAVTQRYRLSTQPTVVLNAPLKSGEPLKGRDVRSAIGLPADVPLIVFVGVANDLRGCDTMVKALEYLDDHHLVFVSQNAYAKELKEKADAGPAAGRFHLHPYVPSHEVTAFVRTADVGIHGLVHYPNGEVALPNKLFEYLHADLPIVASDVAAMKAFVEKHDIGEVYEAGNAESCAAAIKKAFERKSAIRAKITNELKIMYSWEEQSKAIGSTYKKLVALRDVPLSEAERKDAIVARDRAAAYADARLSRAAAEVDGTFVRRHVGDINQAAVQTWVDRRARIVREQGVKSIFRFVGRRLNRPSR